MSEYSSVFQCEHKKIFCERHCRPKTQPTLRLPGTCICACEDGSFSIHSTKKFLPMSRVCRDHGCCNPTMASAGQHRVKAKDELVIIESLNFHQPISHLQLMASSNRRRFFKTKRLKERSAYPPRETQLHPSLQPSPKMKVNV